MTKDVNELRRVSKRLRTAEAAVEGLRRERARLYRELDAAGMPRTEIAEIADVSPGAVYQVLDVRRQVS